MKEINIRNILDHMMGYTPVYHSEDIATYTCGKGLESNMSSFFSALIREAAKCHNYGSDLIYDIDGIRDTMKEFNPEADDMPIIMMGFRKMGVDGNTFIVSRLEGNTHNINKEYFAVAALEVKRHDTYDDWFTLVCNIWHV